MSTHLSEPSSSTTTVDETISNTTTTTTTKRKRNKGVFTFKNYSIHQEHSGQKVGTDALLVVGYTSIAKFKQTNIDNSETANNKLDELVWSNKTYDYNIGLNNIRQHVDEPGEQWPREILDIGTGSGVLSIMLADRFKHSLVNSIDIDESAIKQASINVDNIYQQQQEKLKSDEYSSVDDKEEENWAKNIYLFHTPIQQFMPDTTKTVELEKNNLEKTKDSNVLSVPNDGKYDLIISAPPYFPTDVKIDHFVSNMPTNRRIARHTHTLTMDELVENVKRLLRSEQSIFNTIVSVPHPSQELEEAAIKHGFHCLERIDVTDCPGSKIIRKMYTFKLIKKENEKVEEKDEKEEVKEEEKKEEVKEKEKEEIIKYVNL
ncbi:hypothetical protein DFA_10797 [Cavenderia fasciculata]|uniref:Methyltransferase small domain-containing protein n=1 Tax=Cavenderia fasciculata TaxID=261658 RepID=F4QBF1_CACFS|nr:uncharacterized protein DFA_10797 [Cavenderia fasciculata]EGG14923.1 hypothetical protein DFA_10797 [Cavenderia fasciculata]|eukprot:XP_004351439.1 hypothetical protein DFA_10797 [Cavenderia fasciculata]